MLLGLTTQLFLSSTMTDILIKFTVLAAYVVITHHRIISEYIGLILRNTFLYGKSFRYKTFFSFWHIFHVVFLTIILSLSFYFSISSAAYGQLFPVYKDISYSVALQCGYSCRIYEIWKLSTQIKAPRIYRSTLYSINRFCQQYPMYTIVESVENRNTMIQINSSNEYQFIRK